jgi:hypothetical protein
MSKRNGEKIGWIGGWLGSFLWIFVLALIVLIQGKTVEGILGLVLFCVAVTLVLVLGPWKHPDTHYWKLMLPLYGLLFTSVPWVIWCFIETRDSGFNGWQIFLILPVLMPLITLRKRRWNNNE